MIMGFLVWSEVILIMIANQTADYWNPTFLYTLYGHFNEAVFKSTQSQPFSVVFRFVSKYGMFNLIRIKSR